MKTPPDDPYRAPDLLSGPDATVSLDRELLQDTLELAFLGSNQSVNIDQAFGRTSMPPSGWKPDLYEEDLFLRAFTGSFGTLELDGRPFRAHTEFFRRVIRQPPEDPEVVRGRQQVLRELESNDRLRRDTEELYADLVSLLDAIKAAYRSGDEKVRDRVRILRWSRDVLITMEENFDEASSWLHRLGEISRSMRATPEYRTLEALLEWDSSRARVRLDMRIGAEGRVRDLRVEDIREAKSNPFYLSPLRRWITQLRLFWQGYDMASAELVNRVLVDTFKRLLPFLSALFQLMAHIEVYLISRAFAERLESHGLPVCLPEVGEGARLRIRQLVNPLLLSQTAAPVPCDVELPPEDDLALVTGPNSGGKTRLLQALGLAQVLGQSGLHVAAESATLPLVSGCFASLVHRQGPDQVEGRLGTELVRIRTIFQEMEPGSLILLDELCSGTNPSEAAEIVRMVLDLLNRLTPVAFITTHFLDMARELRDGSEIGGLWFLQVDLDEDSRPTYQFVPGVADTSLAVGTAKRLGVDFDELSELLSRRMGDPEDGTTH